MTMSAAASRGGAWLLEEAACIFAPEQMSDEHRLIARTTGEFADSEVLPALDALEQKDWALARKLLKRCGELGLLGVNVPEAYGGVELDTVSSIIVSEHIARSASFGATYGAQANLSILPILMFGTDDQKSRYLPRPRRRRPHWRLRAERSGLGLRRAERARTSRPPARRQLPPLGREDVDHQRRLRGSVHRLREGRRRALLGVHCRARVRRRHERQRRAQDGTARVVDDAAAPSGACRPRGEPAR